MFENSFSNPLLPPLHWEAIVIFCKMQKEHIFFFLKIKQGHLVSFKQCKGVRGECLCLCVSFIPSIFFPGASVSLYGDLWREFSNTQAQDRLSWERVMGWKSSSEFPLLRVNMSLGLSSLSTPVSLTLHHFGYLFMPSSDKGCFKMLYVSSSDILFRLTFCSFSCESPSELYSLGTHPCFEITIQDLPWIVPRFWG